VDIGQIKFGENFIALGPLALRNVTPGLDGGKRLPPMVFPGPGRDVSDNQARIQFTLAF